METGKIKTPRHGALHRFRKEWIEPLLFALVFAGIIRTFIIQPFKIPSGSMEDTLLVGDHLMAVKFLYGIKIPFSGERILPVREPRSGDIIVFKYPVEPSKDFIKRCIGIGGQRVSIKDKKVYVDGTLLELPPHAKFIDDRIIPHNPVYPRRIGYRDNYPEFVVPENMLFMMGDNRDNSDDSRFWGFVPYENIKGYAYFIYWSWNHDAPLLEKIRWNRLFNRIR